MTSDYEDLAQITAVLEERAVARYRDALSEEMQLRQELLEIDNLRQATTRDNQSTHAHRISGVDAQWQGWLVQRRSAINQQLVLLQIRKADLQNAARLANAKLTSTRGLANSAQKERRILRRKYEDGQLNALMQLRIQDRLQDFGS